MTNGSKGPSNWGLTGVGTRPAHGHSLANIPADRHPAAGAGRLGTQLLTSHRQ
jgi:hypothetical protein